MVRHSTIATLRNIYIYHDEFALIMLKIDSDQEIPILEVNVTVRDFIIGICGLLFALSIISIIFSSFTANSAQSIAIKNNVNNSNNNISSFGMPGHPGGSCTQTTYWDTTQYSNSLWVNPLYSYSACNVTEYLSFEISQVEKTFTNPYGNKMITIDSPEVSTSIGINPNVFLFAEFCHPYSSGNLQCIAGVEHDPYSMSGTVYGVEYIWTPSFDVSLNFDGSERAIMSFNLEFIIQNNGKEVQIYAFYKDSGGKQMNWVQLMATVLSIPISD